MKYSSSDKPPGSKSTASRALNTPCVIEMEGNYIEKEQVDLNPAGSNTQIMTLGHKTKSIGLLHPSIDRLK